MAIVSCPECGKKLKIADASVGKKVKGPCGHVFVAEGGGAPALKPAAAVAPEKVYVGCTECGAKLKVATTSLGKKMKCPKCSATFIANLPDEKPAAKPKAKAPAVTDDDMDDLLSFAQADAAASQSDTDEEDLFKDEPVKSRAQRKMDEEEDADEEPRPKGKAKPRIDEDEEEEPLPKGKKPGKSPSKPPRFGKEPASAAPVYPSRLLPNILVTLMLLGFGGLVGAIFFEVNIAKVLGLPEAKSVRPRLKDSEIVADGKGKGKNPQDKVEPKDKFDPKEKAEPKEKDARKEKGAKKDEKKAARAQADLLTQAAQAYKIKNLKFPQALADLLEKDKAGFGPYIEGKDALLDPWGKPFQYDAAGKRNKGSRPDIWAVAPDGETIGNWPAATEDKKDAEKNSEPGTSSIPK